MSDEKKEVDLDFDLVVNGDLQKNQWPAVMKDIHANEEHKSLMATHMTEELYNKLKDRKSSKAGWTIARAINTGVCYPSSFVGIHAGDMESYDEFKEVFYPVVESYHAGFKMDSSKHVTDLDSSKFRYTLTELAKSKIISTRIRVARNLSAFPLNPGGDLKTRLDVADTMQKVFDQLEGDLGGTFFRHTTMTAEEQKALVDDHFMFRGKDTMQAASGYHEYWPEGRGIFLNKEKTFLLWVNEGDHIRIISMEKGGDVKRVFDRLAKGVKAISDAVAKVCNTETPFMVHPVLGCITCCPSNLGTGMRGGVHLQVPLLIAKIGLPGIDKMCHERECQARGSSGEHSEVVDRIDVSNYRRLGIPEYKLVDDMIGTVNMLAEMEKKLEDGGEL